MNTRKHRTNIRQHPVKRTIQKVKRVCLYAAGGLFLLGMWLTYAYTAGLFGSRAGRALTWSAGRLIAPALTDLPWYLWGGVLITGVYLWTKHKLIMSLILGLIVGLWLAIGG